MFDEDLGVKCFFQNENWLLMRVQNIVNGGWKKKFLRSDWRSKLVAKYHHENEYLLAQFSVRLNHVY